MEKVSSLCHQNEELQSTIDKQILEMEQLKRQDEDYMVVEKDSENMNKLLELESGLQLIARKLGAGDVMDDSKVNGGLWLLPLLEKLITAVMHESETLKLKNEDLGAKLLGAQKAVDDLSNKVKLLEESNQDRVILPEMDQERGSSVSLSTQSEISEMQDMVSFCSMLFYSCTADPWFLLSFLARHYHAHVKVDRVQSDKLSEIILCLLELLTNEKARSIRICWITLQIMRLLIFTLLLLSIIRL